MQKNIDGCGGTRTAAQGDEQQKSGKQQHKETNCSTKRQTAAGRYKEKKEVNEETNSWRQTAEVL